MVKNKSYSCSCIFRKKMDKASQLQLFAEKKVYKPLNVHVQKIYQIWVLLFILSQKYFYLKSKASKKSV